MTKIKDKLPTIPSELLQVALDDMKVTIASGHKVNMDYWGVGIGTKDCTVCFAGGVMLNSLKLTSDNNEFNGWQEQVSESDANALNALDTIREGYLSRFLTRLDKNFGNYKEDNYTSEGLSINRIITGWVDYKLCESNEQFYKQIEDLIEFLKSKNI